MAIVIPLVVLAIAVLGITIFCRRLLQDATEVGATGPADLPIYVAAGCFLLSAGAVVVIQSTRVAERVANRIAAAFGRGADDDDEEIRRKPAECVLQLLWQHLAVAEVQAAEAATEQIVERDSAAIGVREPAVGCKRTAHRTGGERRFARSLAGAGRQRELAKKDHECFVDPQSVALRRIRVRFTHITAHAQSRAVSEQVARSGRAGPTP